MDTLLKFLIFNLETINGQRGSGVKIQEIIGKHRAMTKTMLKYKILRIRYKISYHAFIERRTILEHFMRGILKSHAQLYKAKLIPIYDVYLSEKLKIFNQILDGDVATCFRIIMQLHTLRNIDDINNLEAEIDL